MVRRTVRAASVCSVGLEVGGGPRAKSIPGQVSETHPAGLALFLRYELLGILHENVFLLTLGKKKNLKI